MPELIDRYKQLTAELTQHETHAERVKLERESVCKQLLEQHGKGHAFDLGDGKPVVVVVSKSGTHYMAPRNKWASSGRPPKPAKEKTPRVPKAPKAPVEAKPRMKRMIVNGQVVEIPLDGSGSVPPPPKPASVPPPVNEPVIPAQIAPPPERVEPERVVEPPVEAKPASTPVAPEPTPAKEIDPLEAALAELDL